MTGSRLLDILSRTLSVLQESDGADEHAELIGELTTLVSDVSVCAFSSDSVHFEAGNPLPSEQGPVR
jgi:hypothetical protein